MKPIRLWPGVVAAVLLCLFRFGLPLAEPGLIFPAMIGGMVFAFAIAVWWLFFSRAPWLERIGAIALMVVATIATTPLSDVSIRTAMMGMLLPIYSIFLLGPALVAALVVSRGRSAGFRRASIVLAIVIACGAFTLLRTDGIKGGGSQFAWRWSKTPEQLLLDQSVAAPAPAPPVAPAPASPASPIATADATQAATPAAVREPEWPGFRGPNRDDVVRGVRINTDWTSSPPAQLWRKPIGPGWSSFAVNGDLFYTQEQRGEEEIVACYRVSTGEPVWRHRDAARFWESNAGAGPRATPTLSNGRVYAFGATGILNALDAATGAVVWSRNVATDAEKDVPMWGFASSPLVMGDLVIVAASGKLAAYDIATGKSRWFGPAKPASYSSPHRATIDGVEQVLLLTAAGAIGVAPADGSLLWENAWPEASTIVQPAMTADGDVLTNAITGAGGLGIRRLSVAHKTGQWKVDERWTSTGLKPYFNDFVVHKGHAFGFDGSILSCIDLTDGTRKWKGGRYGDGQLVLLPDQDVLLVLSEDGELALVKATPDQFTELARVPALDGKTWNHPVLVGNILLVRNGEEMAAFRVAPAAR